MKYYPIKIKLKKYAACPSKKYLYFCWGGPALAAEQVVTSPGRVTSARATAASAGLGWAGRGSGPASPASGPRPPGHTAPGTSRSPPGEHTWHVTRAAVAVTVRQLVAGRIKWQLPLIIVTGWQLDLWNDVYHAWCIINQGATTLYKWMPAGGQVRHLVLVVDECLCRHRCRLPATLTMTSPRWAAVLQWVLELELNLREVVMLNRC